MVGTNTALVALTDILAEKHFLRVYKNKLCAYLIVFLGVLSVW